VRAVLAGAGPDPLVAHPSGHAARPSLAERLASRVPVRVDPGRRGAAAIGVAALLAAILTGAWVLRARPQSVPVPVRSASAAASHAPIGPAPSRGAPATAAPSTAAPSTGALPLVVDVAGKVRHPGLYRLPAGSRVADAVAAAGGVRPGVDSTTLNLAARVADGQQIVVGQPVAAQPAADVPAGSVPRAGPVSLNAATPEQLETLPGVGPVLAQHILDWRAAHGRFASIDQLDDVPGIGPAKFAAIKSLVTL
jgi:competence protein ComEA